MDDATHPTNNDADEIDLRLTASEILELGDLNYGAHPKNGGIGVWT